MGKTANLVMSSNERGHFQIVLDGIGNSLLVVVIGFIFIVWIGGFFRHLGIASPAQNNLLVYALIFLVRSLFELLMPRSSTSRRSLVCQSVSLA